MIVSGSSDKSIKLWKISDGIIVFSLKAHTEKVNYFILKSILYKIK
jgi:WD40 repeat protein